MTENEPEIQVPREKKHRCKNCNSTLCYLRVKANEWICRSCGYVEEIKEEND